MPMQRKRFTAKTMPNNKELKQQNVTQLRPSDLIEVIQNGQRKRLMVQAIVDFVGNAVNEMMSAISGGYSATAHTHQIGDIKHVFIDGTVIPAPVIYDGVFNAIKKATVAGGNAVFYFTDDNTPGGNALFPNGPIPNSELFRAEEGTNPHAFGVAVWSNSNKTLTVPVNRNGATLTVLGLTVLGANVAANGSVIYATASGH